MPDQVIIDLIKKEMDGWDGTTTMVKQSPSKPTNADVLARLERVIEYAHNMQAWGLKVRRDILVLEHHVAALAKLASPSVDPKDMFYGDPGDPPPTEPL